MRLMESNLRGFKSRSGIVMPNSASIPLTRSVSANESSRPESNRLSSGSGETLRLAAVWTILRILCCFSIFSCGEHTVAHAKIDRVLFHQIIK